MVYTAGVMLASTCRPAKQISDYKKAVLDHLSYAAINLTWFSLNFVLVTMPPICVFLLQEHIEMGTMDGETGSHYPIMLVIWLGHMLTFMVKLRIYKIKDKETQVENNDDDFQRPSDGKVDT